MPRRKRASPTYRKRCICGELRRGRHVATCPEARKARRALAPKREETARALRRAKRNVREAMNQLILHSVALLDEGVPEHEVIKSLARICAAIGFALGREKSG